MPSQSYNSADKNYESPIKTAMRDDFSYPSKAERFKRRRHENYNYLAGVKAFRQSDKEKEVSKNHYERNLKNLQRNAPKLAADLAKGKKRAIAKFAGNLFRQIDWSVDWLFIFLASFGALKDLFDIAFAALGAVPVLGTAGAAVGIIVSFVGDMMFLILVVTVLVLVGSSLKNRGMAKYFIGIVMEFIAEALPGISWLPWTVVYVFILYFCVLYDRAYGTAGQNEPAEQAKPLEQAAA
ncbi:MAG: hypothetical protein NT093_03055 [Candidatus Moranbacteria bacterium]|nr:hypothetical protein [Candidatus Moranbacteria bacterium]